MSSMGAPPSMNSTQSQRRRVRATIAAALTIAFLLSSCGVPKSASPVKIGEKNIPDEVLHPVIAHSVYLFSADNRIVPKSRFISLSDEPLETLRALVKELRSQPLADERAAGYASPLSQYQFTVDRVRNNVAVVAVQSQGLDKDVPALAALVYTLTGIDGIELVDFESNGKRIDDVYRSAVNNYVPTRPPVGRRDYEGEVLDLTTVTVYLVEGDRILPFERNQLQLERGTDLQIANSYLGKLSEGPTEAERLRGVTSWVADLRATVRSDSNGMVTIDLDRKAFAALNASQQVLALAQILFTIDLANVGIEFAVSLDGAPLRSIPGPFGAISEAAACGPRADPSSTCVLVNKQDYLSVLAPVAVEEPTG